MGIFLPRQLCIIGLLSGLLGFFVSAIPLVKSLEENFGLAFLFKVRGSRVAPDAAVICAIEKKSADFFGLKQQPYKWPRTLHARIINRLTDMGVAAVGLDLFFEETRSAENDRILARAMRESGKVVLLQRLKDLTEFSEVNRNNSGVKLNNIRLEQLISPVSVLQRESYALAPFPLPRLPARLNQAWLFKEGVGDRATLPVVLFAMFMPDLLDRFIDLAGFADPSVFARDGPYSSRSAVSPRLDTILQQVKTIFSVRRDLAAKMKKSLIPGYGRDRPVRMKNVHFTP